MNPAPPSAPPQSPTNPKVPTMPTTALDPSTAATLPVPPAAEAAGTGGADPALVGTTIDLSRFKRVNLGCGPQILKGYLNVGYWRELMQGMVYQAPTGIPDTYMLNHDLARGIPMADGSLDVVYHSHFLEHLSFTEGIALLKEAHRVLRPGGLHRIVVPDLAMWINAYAQREDHLFDTYREQVLAPRTDDNAAWYGTRAAVMMGMLHGHGHKCGWDFETLAFVLGKIGFTQIRRTLFQESALDDIAQTEPFQPMRALESLCLECRR